jgi:hypothetical protein
MGQLKSLVLSFLLLHLINQAPRTFAQLTRHRRGGEDGKHQFAALDIKPGTDLTRPASTRNHLLLLTMAGYVVADILPSLSRNVHDIFEAVVEFALELDDYEEVSGSGNIEGWWDEVLEHAKNAWKPLASTAPSVQWVVGAAMLVTQ